MQATHVSLRCQRCLSECRLPAPAPSPRELPFTYKYSLLPREKINISLKGFFGALDVVSGKHCTGHYQLTRKCWLPYQHHA